MKFRIVLKQFKFPMYAFGLGMSADWTDNPEQAYVYDEASPYTVGDHPETKLKYWRGVASMHGYDPDKVQVEEYIPSGSV